VQIEVGGWGPLRVVLDTGSSGLHVFAGAVNVGSGVTATGQASNITYSGGYRFKGVVASARIRLGGSATAGRVSFALVQDVSCTAAKPQCPGAGGIQAFESARGVDGILGIGLQHGAGGITNPLLDMIGPLGRSWSLHLERASGQLALGAQVVRHEKFVAGFQLRTAGTSGGHALWADSRIPLCVTVGSMRGCVPALFDSGTPATQISGLPLNRAPTMPGTTQVASGTPVAVASKGASAFWTFTAGSKRSANLVRVISGRRPFFNSGVQPFYAFTVTYDAGKGRITLTS
jgi:hypothetical protein